MMANRPWSPARTALHPPQRFEDRQDRQEFMAALAALFGSQDAQMGPKMRKEKVRILGARLRILAGHGQK